MSTFQQENQNSEPWEDARVEPTADDAEKGNYQVGYKRPPRQTRFKPGQSGNPRGRPKGTPNHRTTVNKVMNEKISLREGEKKRRMTKFEALLQAQANKGMKGDARSAGMIINVMGKSGLLADEDNAVKVNVSEAKETQMPTEDDSPRPGDVFFAHIEEARLSREELIELASYADVVDRRGFGALSISELERLQQIWRKGGGKDTVGA